jgi:hypothetical protein
MNFGVSAVSNTEATWPIGSKRNGKSMNCTKVSFQKELMAEMPTRRGDFQKESGSVTNEVVSNNRS